MSIPYNRYFDFRQLRGMFGLTFASFEVCFGMKVAYFQTGMGYVAVTDESPKGFKDVLYVGKGGPLDKIEEQVFEATQIRRLTKVALKDVPDAWLLALGYDYPPMPAPEPKPSPEPALEPVEESPLFDPDTFDLLAYVPIRRQPAAQASHGSSLGLIIGILIGIICLLLGLI
jgi:hypothetical protein